MQKYLPLLFLLLVACEPSDSDSNSTATIEPENLVVDENTAIIDPQAYELTPVAGTDLQTAVRRNARGKVLEMGNVDGSMRKQGDWTIYHTDNKLPAEIATFVDGKYHGALIKIDLYGKVDEMMHY
ncbi:MAG: hypothetical protein AAFN65_11300, partial [Bacteroidota bacterium]